MGLYDGARRYYHRKRMNARARGDFELEGLWRYKQELCTPNTARPTSLPYGTQLTAAGYDVLEDLLGADADELVQVAGLTPTEAAEVVAAMQIATTALLTA